MAEESTVVANKRERDNENQEEENEILPESKRIRADLLFDIFDEESEPDITDIDSVVKILEEEIALSDQVSDPDPDQKQADLGFLLEASDDELGLPPADSEVTAGELFAGGDELADGKIWGLDDEIRLDFGFDGGDDGGVALDGGLFSDLTWQTEFLPAV